MGMTCSVGPHSVSTDIAVLLAHGTTTDCLVMSLTEVVEGQYYSFPEEVLKLWEEIDAFGEQLRRTEGRPEFVFYDGPPFATGLPHYGHLLAGTIKDIVTRYASTTGRHVVRRFGWDCHGLPVEHEIDKKLKISGKSDVMKLGIAKYNEECRSIVLRYSTEWKKTVTRIGRWIDFENDYKTMDPSFMESIWWVFKSLYEKNLVYKGFKVMPYSTACNTPLSNFEAGLDYRDVSDPAVTVTFPILECELRASLVAWTTTPWTLPSNVALCVHPELKYVYVKDPKDNVYVVAEARLESLPGAIKKCKENKKTLSDGWSVIKTVNGKSLSGLSYEPVFDWFKESMMQKQAFKVCVDTYVTDDSGTGIVHQAPAYGEDDYRVCLANGIIQKDAVLPDPVDANGCFMEPAAAAYLGVYIKDADKLLIQEVKERGRLIENARIVHSYPFCWRSQTPLIYRAVASYFVKVADIKDRLVANNLLTRWVPSYVQEKRFHNWLENAHDWAISRNRYWGTPIPVWSSPAGDESIIVGSIAELEKLTGKVVTDLHRHFIDDLEIPSQRGPEFPALRRIEDVFDCWFESGSMPYAQQHYPFESKQSFEDAFPADFVAEGLDQTRGWFYTLMVLSTALFDKPAFKNLICNGLVLAADGKKMSKSLKNYPDPTAILDKYGADALRLYLIDSPVVRAEPLRFKEEGVFGVLKDVFLPWYNAYRFLVQNILAFEETSGKFVPTKCDTVNVLDIWILSSTNSLVKFVTEEMSSYRLYTVVPKLISFISQLTNIYVRYNRGRLKGKDGVTESRTALNVLYHVSMTLCKTMAPFTPFFTENMYRNLRRCLPNSEESVHFCEFPTYDETSSLRIEASVSKMQAMIETARAVREKVGKPLKMPISKMTLVDDDVEFLHDAQNELLPYIKDELNIRCLEVSSNAAAFASLRAEPNFATLGKRLGKSMKRVADQIKTWDQEKIISFQTTQAAVEDGHELTGADVIIKYEFTQEGSSDSAHATIGARGMIVLDLRVDDSLLYSGAARLLVNRVQKLRKTVGLRTNDAVGLLYVLTGHTKNNFVSEMLRAEEEYIVSSLGGLPTVQCNRVHVIFGSDEFEISEGVFMRIFAVRPSPKMESLRVQGESKADEILQLVLAHDSTALQTELSTGEGKEFQLNGQTIRIVQRR